MKTMEIIRSVMAALPLILPICIIAETERVGDYTWQYSVVDGKAWIGSGVAETAAIFPKPVGEVTVPSELGGYEVWRLDDYALYGCDEMTRLVIPDTVCQMGTGAFRNCTALNTVQMSKSFERVSDYAFRDCQALKDIEVPATVEDIGEYAFSKCTSLTNVSFNGSVKTIARCVFQDCGLRTAVLPEGLESVGDNIFLGCHSLTNAVIPNSVTNIGIYAFSYCRHLESLTLPFIGSERGNSGTAESAFGHIFGLSASEGLTNVVQTYAGSSTISRYIPRSLKKIIITDEEVVAKGAFDNCMMIEEIEINGGVTSIGEWAFSACPLTTMTIPNSVTNIGQNAFSCCSALKSLTLPFIGSKRGNDTSAECVFGWIFGVSSVSSDDDKYIQVKQWCNGGPFSCNIPKSLKSVVIADETIVAYAAFDDCRSLSNVVIGNSVTNIQARAFTACIGLQSLTLPFVGVERNASSGTMESVFGYIFGVKSGQGLVQVRQSLGNSDWTTNYVPNALANITITDATRIGYGAFYGCSMITNISLNVGIENIGGYSFRNCTGLKCFEIPSSVTQIGMGAFRGSGLENIFIPLTVSDIYEIIGDPVFGDCPSLRLAYVPKKFKTIGDNVFTRCPNDLQIIYYDENMRFFDETLRTEDNSAINLVTACTNDCRVTFKWKCSCEPMFKGNPYDYLSFSIDGVQQAFICGETDWTNQSYTVSGAGEHTFTWTYQKDAQDAAGEDCGCVKQVVVAPLVTLSFDGGEAESGAAPSIMSFYADDDTAVLPGCGTLALANYSFAGWSDGETVYAAGSACPYLKAAQTLTAVWAANTLSAPVITAPATYEADTATVSITADEGASIYYTIDGSVPSADGAGSSPYLGPFEVEGNATVRAIAVRDNYFDSEVSQFEVVRLTWTFGEYLNCPGRTFTTGGDAEWVRAKDVSADGFALQSGAITHSQTSRLETVVYGAGTVTFRCKVDGEIIKKIVYDGLAFWIDGIQQGDLMGDADWTEKTFTVTGDGRHVLGWCYVKDEDGNGGGEDCAWLDCVTWTADDPLPALDVAATDGDANAIIAGLSDGRLSEKVFGTAAYGTFRTWVDGKGLSHAAVRDAPNAWFSYALDAPGLMSKATPLVSEDIVIESIEPFGVTSGAFDLVVDIAGAEIGTAARLAEVLGVEGATELNESAFSSKGLTVTLQRTGDGKIKATVTPVCSPASFFLRVKVK